MFTVIAHSHNGGRSIAEGLKNEDEVEEAMLQIMSKLYPVEIMMFEILLNNSPYTHIWAS